MSLTIVGGYLGAGKTTLVNRRLGAAQGRRIAVLVNDFGEVNVDAELVEGRTDDVLRLTGGCICCSFGADLVGALRRVLAHEPPYDDVLVEASGVASPSAIARTIEVFLGRQARRLTVVDATRIRALVDDRYVGDTVRRQLADADELVLSHGETLDDEELAALRAWLASLLLEPVPIHAAPAAEHFRRCAVAVERPVDVAALGAAIAALDPPVERAKGILVDRRYGLLALQVVRGRLELGPAPAGATATALVCIGLRGRFDATAIEAIVAGQATGGGSVRRALAQ